MLQDCVQVFKKVLERESEQLLIDNHMPKDGFYIIISDHDGQFKIEETIEIRYDKKQDILMGLSNPRIHDIRYWDYHSVVLDTQKVIKDKKIHSNNYLTFFMKAENLTNNRVPESSINEYFDRLKNPYIKYSNKKSREIYQDIESKLQPIDTELLERIRKWVIENISKFSIMDINFQNGDYFKIFFQYSRELYLQESTRYLVPNIYNSNDYNVSIEDRILGLPNNNMGMNSKKPYLENKSRGSVYPYLLDSKEVMLQKKMFDYLSSLAATGKNNIYIDLDNIKIISLKNGDHLDNDFSGIFFRIMKAKETAIVDMDSVNHYRYRLPSTFILQNIVQVDLHDMKGDLLKYYDRPIEKLSGMQEIINEILFNKYLVSNYSTDPEDLPNNMDDVLRFNLLISRNRLSNWFYKGENTGIGILLKKVSMNLVLSSISNGYYNKACHQFNLGCTLSDYFSRGARTMENIVNNDIVQNLRIKINANETGSISDDKEYYFAIGQVVNYFISLNKGSKKTHNLANPFFLATNDEIIKNKLKNMFVRYNYAISTRSKRFNNLYGMIEKYIPTGNVNKDMMIAGYLSNSLIYEKEEKENA